MVDIFIFSDSHLYSTVDIFTFNEPHLYSTVDIFIFNGSHLHSMVDISVQWSSNFARAIERFFNAAKAKSNMCQKGMAIVRAMIFRYKISRILSNVILGQFLFENEKQPFENWVSDVWKLNGKLFRFSCEGTYIYYIQKKFFFEKADPKTPTLTCAQNLCMEETCKLKN